MLNPENALVWHQTVLNWINKYVGLPPVPGSPEDMFGSNKGAPLEKRVAEMSLS